MGEQVDISLIALLLTYDAGINDTDIEGNTPLHLAAKNLKHVGIVQFLLSKGANANTRNLKRNPPLHEAASGHLVDTRSDLILEYKISKLDEMIGLLREAGGSVDMIEQPNVAGKTPRQIRGETIKEWQDLGKPREEIVYTGRGRGRRREVGGGTT